MRLRGSGHVGRSVGVAGLLIALIVTGSGPRPSAHGRVSGVTWSEHVRPILEQRCASCHAGDRSAGTALALVTLPQVVDAAKAIKRAALQRTMPPWNGVQGFGVFENDRSLSTYELDLIVSWVDGGMLPGPAQADAPHVYGALPAHDPDLVIDTGRESVVDSTRKTYRVATTLPADRWIRGWQFRPGNAALVRRARIVIEPSSLAGIWLPDEEAVFFPSPAGLRLPRGATIRMEIDYVEPAARATDRSRLDLYFDDGGRTPLSGTALTRGTNTLRDDLRVIALTPALAGTGQSLRVVATRPDGSVEPLLWIKDFDPRFSRTYRLQRLVSLPRGTRIDVWSFDADAAVELASIRATPRVRAPGGLSSKP